MNPQPSRVLGDGSTGDNPYQSQSASASADHEIVDLAQEEPTERTALLSSSAAPGPHKIQKPFENLGPQSGSSSAGGSGTKKVTRRRRAPTRPKRLKISFALACILLYVNFSFLILTSVSTSSPFFAHNALPAHFGSTFIPIWLSLLSALVNSMALIAFVLPTESPHLAAFTSLASAFLLLIQLILILAVSLLRRGENVLTLVTIGLAIVSLVHAAASALLVERYAPLLLAGEPTSEMPEPGFVASMKRFGKAAVGFFGVSLPIVLVHLAILSAFLLLTVTTCIRAFDSSYEMEPSGHRWKVNPWRRRNGAGTLEVNGRPYWLHLGCRGVEVDPIFMSQNTSVAVQTVKPRPIVRRTILIESDRGVPGKVGAEWISKMLREGLFTSADTEVRVCYYDRPGYGFSENSPTSSVPHVVTALSRALFLSGEMARLEPSPTFIPSPLARSGFILVSTSYGSLLTTLFAALHPTLIHSALYLSPTPPALQYSPDSGHTGLIHTVKFFFTTGLSSWFSELGVWKILSAFRGKSRESRVYSTARQAQRGELQRAWVQEEGERSPNSDSALAWNNARTRYPERPTIVLSADRMKGVAGRDWLDSQERFVKDVVGEGLVEWVQGWKGVCGDGKDEGEGTCRKWLMKLVKMD